MTPLASRVSWISTLRATGLETERSLSTVFPRFSIVRYPAATFAPLGVARLQACRIIISAERACAEPGSSRPVAQINTAAISRIAEKQTFSPPEPQVPFFMYPPALRGQGPLLEFGSFRGLRGRNIVRGKS